MAANQGAPTLPWSRLPHIGHSTPSPIPQPHQAAPTAQPNQVLFTPRFQATIAGSPPPTANPPPLIPTNVFAPPSPPRAPQRFVAKATIEQESSPIVSKDPQSGAANTSPIISHIPTPTFSPSENVKRSQAKTSSALTCCLL